MTSESSNVFLVECDAENFELTVVSLVDLSDYADRPDVLKAHEEARVWGVPGGDSNRTYFDNMATGDIVLFYRDGEYVGTGQVGSAFEDENGWVSSTLWNGKDANLVFVIKEFTEVSVPMPAVHRIFDYSGSYRPPEFMRVAANRVKRNPAAIKLGIEKYSQNHS